MPYVGLVISFNNLPLLKKCLRSLLSDKYCSKVLIIDNGSDQDTVSGLDKIVADNGSMVQVEYLSNNIGFARACNLGFQKLVEMKYQYVFLLNQDAFLLSSSAQPLLSKLKNNTKNIIVSPLHYSSQPYELEPAFKMYVEKYFYSRMSVFRFINAAAWMIDMIRLSEVGFFNPRFFMYGEDYNLCQRISLKGYTIDIDERVKVVHQRNIEEYENSFKRMQMKMHGYWMAMALNPLTDMVTKIDFTVQVAYSIVLDVLNFRFYRLLGSLLAYFKILLNWTDIQKTRMDKFHGFLL